MKKIALFFPGIGYTCDKPLIYYPEKIAKKYSYEIKEVRYGNFPKNIKGDKEKMKESFNIAFQQAKEILSDINYSEYDEILIVGKSIGTVVSSCYAKELSIEDKCRFIYYTPVAQSFKYIKPSSGICFHGTSDPWIDTDIVKSECSRLDIHLYLTENGNHSLETGDVEADLKELSLVMNETENYIKAGIK